MEKIAIFAVEGEITVSAFKGKIEGVMCVDETELYKDRHHIPIVFTEYSQLAIMEGVFMEIVRPLDVKYFGYSVVHKFQ